MVYKCEKCNIEKHLLKTTLFFINDELEVKEALCECGIYMKQVDEEKYNVLSMTIDIDANAVDDLQADVFVPFYRMGQISEPRETRRGTQSGKGLFVALKGSVEPVDNVFVNMEKFVRAGITQGIANHKAIQQIQTAFELQPEDNLIVRKVLKATPNFEENTVEVSTISGIDGKQRREKFEFSDAFYATAIRGVASSMFTGTNMFANATTFLRDNIVKNPVFALSQTFIQDMFSATFASGLRYGPLTIPLRVLYQFPATILGISKTHKELNKLDTIIENRKTFDDIINSLMDKNYLTKEILSEISILAKKEMEERLRNHGYQVFEIKNITLSNKVKRYFGHDIPYSEKEMLENKI